MSEDHHDPILLQAIDIRKDFHYPKTVHILQGINLTVCAGQSVAIVGRSGEGKSTLLQILGTLEKPCQGTLKIAAQEVSSSNKNRILNQHIGFVFQSFHLLEDYTALENVLMPARIARKNVKKGSESFERGIYLLEQVGLANRAHFHTKLLSGGEKQRVALARAMCNDPDLIFADEPSGNLDSHTAQIIHDLLFSFVQEQKKALVVVTHDLHLAQLCAKQYELKEGLLHEMSTINREEEIKEEPSVQSTDFICGSLLF